MNEQTTPIASEQGNPTDQVFERFKVYLDQKVSNLTSTLTAKAGRDLSLLTTCQQLKFAGDKDQFLFNAELETSIEDSTELLHKQDVYKGLCINARSGSESFASQAE